MSENPERDLLKSISDKLTWALLFLFVIMLNTCSLGDDVADAIRERQEPTPAAAPAASSPASTQG